MAYQNYVRGELEREKWELENFPEGEITEMIDLYTSRCMNREGAAVVIW